MNPSTKTSVKSCLLFLIIITFPIFSSAQVAVDDQSIQKIIQEEITSWNAGDAKGYSNHFAQDGTFTNILGQFYTGYQPFLEKHEMIFKSVFKGTKLELNVTSLQFVKPDVAILETLSWVSGITTPPPGAKLDAKGRLVTRLLQVLTKDGADWKIVAYHNVDVKPGTLVPEPK